MMTVETPTTPTTETTVIDRVKARALAIGLGSTAELQDGLVVGTTTDVNDADQLTIMRAARPWPMR